MHVTHCSLAVAWMLCTDSFVLLAKFIALSSLHIQFLNGSFTHDFNMRVGNHQNIAHRISLSTFYGWNALHDSHCLFCKLLIQLEQINRECKQRGKLTTFNSVIKYCNSPEQYIIWSEIRDFKMCFIRWKKFLGSNSLISLFFVSIK